MQLLSVIKRPILRMPFTLYHDKLKKLKTVLRLKKDTKNFDIYVRILFSLLKEKRILLILGNAKSGKSKLLDQFAKLATTGDIVYVYGNATRSLLRMDKNKVGTLDPTYFERYFAMNLRSGNVARVWSIQRGDNSNTLAALFVTLLSETTEYIFFEDIENYVDGLYNILDNYSQVSNKYLVFTTKDFTLFDLLVRRFQELQLDYQEVRLHGFESIE